MKGQVASALASNTSEIPGKDSQQVIILMTDSEYSSEVAAKFQHRTPALLRIKNEEGIISTIEAFK